MAEGIYRIIDEPQPSGLGRVIVNPFWIVIAAMVAPSILRGVLPQPQLLMLLWFGLNSFALHSPTRRAEVAWIVAGFLIAGMFFYLPRQLVVAGAVPLETMRAAIPYVWILRSAIDLTVLYRLFLYQTGPYQLHLYLHPDRA